jgi:hypothetical protein
LKENILVRSRRSAIAQLPDTSKPETKDEQKNPNEKSEIMTNNRFGLTDILENFEKNKPKGKSKINQKTEQKLFILKRLKVVKFLL